MTSQTHQDAALVAAWNGYVMANRAFDHAVEHFLPNGGTNADHMPFYQAIDFYGDLIEQLDAHTVEGVSIKLRYALAKDMGCMASFKSAVYDEPESEELAAALAVDGNRGMLWAIARNAHFAESALIG